MLLLVFIIHHSSLTDQSSSKCRRVESFCRTQVRPGKIHLYVAKLAIDFTAVNGGNVLSQPSASGIFGCPSCRRFVCLPFVCSGCALSVQVCIRLLLLYSEPHLKATLKTKTSRYRACISLCTLIFCVCQL